MNCLAEPRTVRYMAEREGFEPSRELAPPYSFSKAAPSATWVPLLVTICSELTKTFQNKFQKLSSKLLRQLLLSIIQTGKPWFE